MTVHCPHCATGYVLPDHLVGANGSRVRCPECQGAFVVIPENGRHAAQGGADVVADRAATAMVTVTVTAEDPALVAAAVLDVLQAQLGENLERSRVEGRVLSRHGPAILEAFDEYRRRAGDDADATPFRDALRDRCGVDLTPPGSQS